jgi:hypothetical protein
VEDFYDRMVEANVEAARRLEPVIELAEVAGNVLSHAGAAAEFAEQYEPIRRQAQEFAGSWRAVHLGPLVKAVHLDLGIAAAIMPIVRQNAELLTSFRGLDWPSLAREMPATVMAAMQALAGVQIEAAGVGVVALPKPSMSGVGEVVLPGGTNAWPAIAEQLQRIGALDCGTIYAIVFVLVMFIFWPELADDIGATVLFIAITNAIMRNGKR